ncbi:hypothetical protein EK904_010109, partial [Melospiza melodia maxima]
DFLRLQGSPAAFGDFLGLRDQKRLHGENQRPPSRGHGHLQRGGAVPDHGAGDADPELAARRRLRLRRPRRRLLLLHHPRRALRA